MLYLKDKEYEIIRSSAFEAHTPMTKWVREQLFDKISYMNGPVKKAKDWVDVVENRNEVVKREKEKE